MERSEKSVSQRIKDTLLQHYTFLTTLPHIDADTLRVPPESGWQNVDVETLRQQGKTEDVIELMKHLPYLAHKNGDIRTYLTPFTYSLYIDSGETIESYIHDILPTPDHVLWISKSPHRDGRYLLLDTHVGMSKLYLK